MNAYTKAAAEMTCWFICVQGQWGLHPEAPLWVKDCLLEAHEGATPNPEVFRDAVSVLTMALSWEPQHLDPEELWTAAGELSKELANAEQLYRVTEALDRWCSLQG